LKTDKTLKNIHVIVLSGIAKRTFLRSQKALTDFGGAEVPEPEFYLEKPVEAEDLAKTIKNVIG
jgi:twitching motility two-component system response regulator PilH